MINQALEPSQGGWMSSSLLDTKYYPPFVHLQYIIDCHLSGVNDIPSGHYGSLSEIKSHENPGSIFSSHCHRSVTPTYLSRTHGHLFNSHLSIRSPESPPNAPVRRFDKSATRFSYPSPPMLGYPLHEPPWLVTHRTMISDLWSSNHRLISSM